jgi:transcriptional antiterminator RfaH
MTSHEGNTIWSLAQLKPNCSHVAQKNLQRQGYRSFLPLEEVTLQKIEKFVTAKRPLFPGYFL